MHYQLQESKPCVIQGFQKGSLKEADSPEKDHLDFLSPLYDLEFGCNVQSSYSNSFLKLRIGLWIAALQKLMEEKADGAPVPIPAGSALGCTPLDTEQEIAVLIKPYSFMVPINKVKPNSS